VVNVDVEMDSVSAVVGGGEGVKAPGEWV
jgi:hypothetical protein